MLVGSTRRSLAALTATSFGQASPAAVCPRCPSALYREGCARVLPSAPVLVTCIRACTASKHCPTWAADLAAGSDEEVQGRYTDVMQRIEGDPGLSDQERAGLKHRARVAMKRSIQNRMNPQETWMPAPPKTSQGLQVWPDPTAACCLLRRVQTSPSPIGLMRSSPRPG